MDVVKGNCSLRGFGEDGQAFAVRSAKYPTLGSSKYHAARSSAWIGPISSRGKSQHQVDDHNSECDEYERIKECGVGRISRQCK